MRHTRPLLALILTATMPFAVLAAGATKGQKSTAPLTVGDFAVMLANATGKGPALEVKSATEALVKAGVPLGDSKATLSEQKLAEILGFYGVKVKSTSPEQSVSMSKAQSALNLVSGAVTNQATTAGTGPVPETLDDCLAEANHGQCVNCCKTLPGSSGNSCARFCQQIKVSEGEPQP